MKISLNWIKEFTDIKLGVDELVTKIGAQLGEVEKVINLGERYEGIVVVKVVSCEKHPNADKLQICKIDDDKVVKGVKRDDSGFIQVVCGAPNVRAGITVAWIPPGAIVPSSFETEKFKLDSRKLRGVISNGMLASGKELVINDNHDGILILDKPCNPGDRLSEVYKLDDYIIDVENKMFTHRPDCFGQLGVAREIAGIQGVKFTSPSWYLESLANLKPTSSTQLELSVVNKIPNLATRFMVIPIASIKIQPSPIIMQSFLSRVGINTVNNAVDITNFVMALTGQPLHAYDYDKLRLLDNSTSANFVIRLPKPNDKLELLNGKTKTPSSESIIIASSEQPIGIGGVMGGKSTEVDSSTKNIILECASFDMYAIRRSSMANGLFTDAVTRFSKGQSSLMNKNILAFAVELIIKFCGGNVAGELVDNNSNIVKNKTIKISQEFINSRLGTKLTPTQIKDILINVEFEVALNETELKVTPPDWRTDIEIAEDIVEEVGRLYGYDNIPIILPTRLAKPAKQDPLISTKQKTRRILASAGANEVLTYSFVHGKLFKATGQDKTLAYSLINALSPDLQYYRLSLLPSLLEKVHSNIKAGHSRFALFEINKTHDKSNLNQDGLPIEEERLALVFVADKKSAKLYNGSAYYQAQVYLNYLLESFGIKNLVFEPASSHQPKTETGLQVIAPFEKSRSAYCKTADGILLGVVGEIKPEIKLALKLPEYVAGFELDLKEIEANQKTLKYQTLSRYPSTEQDISFKINDTVDYQSLFQNVEELVKKSAKEQGYIWNISPVDIYQEAKGIKHITLRINLSHPELTLTTKEVNKLLDEIAEVLAIKLKAKRL